jgi:hypothetical protein
MCRRLWEFAGLGPHGGTLPDLRKCFDRPLVGLGIARESLRGSCGLTPLHARLMDTPPMGWLLRHDPVGSQG